jgi:hypothetical protein
MTKQWGLALLPHERPLIASMVLDSLEFDRRSCALRAPAAVPRLQLVHRITILRELCKHLVLKISIQKQKK